MLLRSLLKFLTRSVSCQYRPINRSITHIIKLTLISVLDSILHTIPSENFDLIIHLFIITECAVGESEKSFFGRSLYFDSDSLIIL